MNKTNLMMTAVLASVLLSCAGAEIITTDEDSKVNFTDGGLTRATGNTWAAGDQIGISMYNQAKTSVVNGYSNYCYQANAAGTNTTFTQKSGEMYFPGKDYINFCSYYPYNASYTTTIPINTATTQVDFMAGVKYWSGYIDGKTVGLTFEYKLAKIIVKLVAGTGSPDLGGFYASAEYGYWAGSYDIANGTITKTGSTEGLVAEFASTGNENEYYALIIPQTMPSNSYIAISTNLGSNDFSIANQVFAAKEYTYTITVNNGSMKVTGATTITDRTKESISGSLDI